MNKYIVLSIAGLALIGCSQNKEKEASNANLMDEAEENVQYAVQRHDSLKRTKFIEEYAALDGEERDSIFYVTLNEYREGTDFTAIARQTYEAARRKGIKFKACVILDNKEKELGRYE